MDGLRLGKPIFDEYINNSGLQNEYFSWLCDIIHVNQRDKSYWLLAKALHKKEFYWTVPNDDNRGEDGKKLRDKFAEENHYPSYEAIEGPCSMLEMLIALAGRFEDVMADGDEGDRTSDWFWTMMHNCELDRFTDDDYADLSKEVTVEEIINGILERQYRRSGKGGLFPLKYTKKDQRKVEIWYQMSEYILENFYVEEKKM